MGKGRKGFNTPFAGLKLEVEPSKGSSSKPASEPLATPSSPTTHASDDDELFLREMRGVAPKSTDRDRVEPAKTLETQTIDDDALAYIELQELVNGQGSFSLEDSGEMVSGRVDGVSRTVLDKLKAGGFAFRRHLDLHGHDRDAARDALNGFVAEARRDNERCVLIITGRGRRSPDGLSVLREALPRWLSRAPLKAHTLAFCTARRVDGGPGAFYVLLRRPGVKPYGSSV